MRMKDTWSSKDCQRLLSQTLRWNKMEASNPSRAHPWRQKVGSYSLMVWLSPKQSSSRPPFSIDLCSYWPFLAQCASVHHKYCCWFRFYPKMKITLRSCMKQQLPTIDFPTATITAHYDITGQKAVGKPFGMSSFSLNISCSVKCNLSPNNFDLIGKKGWIASQKRILCYSKWSNGLHRLSLLMFFW